MKMGSHLPATGLQSRSLVRGPPASRSDWTVIGQSVAVGDVASEMRIQPGWTTTYPPPTPHRRPERGLESAKALAAFLVGTPAVHAVSPTRSAPD
ncbi:hypothetical protein [Haloferax larsenii]|uniref:hypothetical protein n=1 Tax=Haloferax larsenii TaxID=302484 RepID=UPI0014807BB5|nr:hypothetical protein [Haloferax larsenii]